MTRPLLLPFAVAMLSTATAQWDTIDYAVPDTSMVRYEGGFDFREGIYFGFEDLRANRPSVLLKQLLNAQGEPAGDLRQSESRLFYMDSTGTKQRIDMDRAWGFCDRDVVYVHIGDGFNRIGLMGSLAHLVYDASYRNWGAYDPSYGTGPSTVTVQEQRLLDMETGNFIPVDAEGIYQVIQRDAILREEFEALPKKERRSDAVVFRFIRRYNERHPLYFPN